MKRTECDAPACPARATTMVYLPTGTLAFCSHHMREYGPSLVPLTVHARLIEDPVPPPEPEPEPRQHPHRDAVDGMQDR